MDAARRAPSGDNCQPWRFAWDGTVLRVRFLRDRAESFYDVRDCASWISLGAVLTNMRVAAQQSGMGLAVELFPAGEPEPTVARVRFRESDAAGDPLFPAVEHRCVNRRPYRPDPLPETTRDELLGLASSAPGVRMRWIEGGPSKARLAALAALNDRVLFEHRSLHHGLYRWIRWSRAEVARSFDGMPIATLELSALERPGFRLMRSWAWARLLAAIGVSRMLPERARRIYVRSGAIALLTVAGREPTDFVRAGEVLERIWLTATLRGLAFQPITGITFLALRSILAGNEGLSDAHRRLLERAGAELRTIFGLAPSELPAVLFRLGVGRPPSARAPRFPVDEILTTVQTA